MAEFLKPKGNQECLEKDLFQMSYKELKKVAGQRNINPKLKKAQLLKALLTVGETFSDKSDNSDSIMLGRLTRSKARSLRSCNNNNSIEPTEPVPVSAVGKKQVPTSMVRSSTFVVESPEPTEPVGVVEKLPAPSSMVRSSTFVLDHPEPTETVSAVEKVPAPFSMVRSSTFVLDHPETTQTVSDVGNKEVATVLRRSTCVLPVPGSTAQKTKSKYSRSPGSLFKSGSKVVRKPPNFKAIHKRLFAKMESLSDNRNRKLARAVSLLQSPVPRCAAVVPPNIKLLKEKLKSNSTFKTGIPMKICTPNVIVNKNRMDKAKCVTSKVPPVNLEKKKDQERSYIKGVRMNKRFQLQMEMRQKN